MKDLLEENLPHIQESHLVYFKTLKEEFEKSDKLYLYNIVHCMNIEPRNLYVSVSLTPTALKGVIAYIEHIAFEYTNSFSYSLAEKELMEVINEFYADVKYLEDEPNTKFQVIDLFYNWERHAVYPYEAGIPELHLDGMLDYIKDLSIRNKWGNKN